jgi:hypothetical protein
VLVAAPESLDSDMAKVLVTTKACGWDYGTLHEGDHVDLPDDEAARLVEAGLAVYDTRTVTPRENADTVGEPSVKELTKRHKRADRMVRGAVTR